MTTIKKIIMATVYDLEDEDAKAGLAQEGTILKQIPAKPVVAAPKGAASYDWFVFTRAEPLNMTSQGGSKLSLKKGSKFGVRDSASKKYIRLIGQETGVNKVFTLPFDEMHVLIQNCTPTKNPL